MGDKSDEQHDEHRKAAEDLEAIEIEVPAGGVLGKHRDSSDVQATRALTRATWSLAAVTLVSVCVSVPVLLR